VTVRHLPALELAQLEAAYAEIRRLEVELAVAERAVREVGPSRSCPVCVGEKHRTLFFCGKASVAGILVHLCPMCEGRGALVDTPLGWRVLGARLSRRMLAHRMPVREQHGRWFLSFPEFGGAERVVPDELAANVLEISEDTFRKALAGTIDPVPALTHQGAEAWNALKIVFGHVEDGSACGFCGRPSTKLCDGPGPDGETCDAPLCDDHARRIGRNRDLCPVHQLAALPRIEP
jgi:hypothetical protein